MSGYGKIISYSIGGALLTVAMYFFLIQPALEGVKKLAVEEQSTRAEVDRLEKQILAFRTAQSDLSKVVQKELLFSTIVEDKKLAIPIEEMEAAALITGTNHTLKILRDTLESVAGSRRAAAVSTDKPIVGHPQIAEIPYDLTVQNRTYKGLTDFFQYLEHLPHFTEVSNISISLQETETAGEILTASIKGVFLVKNAKQD